jgi:ankyrin repeat protein
MTALAKAVASNNELAVLKILESDHHALEESDAHGNTIINSACAVGVTSTLLVALIEAGGNVSKPNDRGITPLMNAVSAGGKVDIMTALVKHGADPNAQNPAGGTALQIACIMKLSTKSLKCLLDLGADPTITNNSGWSPLLLAVKHRLPAESISLIALASKPTAINYKLPDTDEKYPGYSAFHLAIADNQELAIAILIRSGIDDKIVNARGETGLGLATGKIRDALISGDPVSTLTSMANPNGNQITLSTNNNNSLLPPPPPSSPRNNNNNNNNTTTSPTAKHRKSMWKAMNEQNPFFTVFAKQTTNKMKLKTQEEIEEDEKLARMAEEREAAQRRAMQKLPAVKFPTTHSPFPKTNIFENKKMNEPSRVLYMLEQNLTSNQSIQRAFTFIPNENDVIVCSPLCGNSGAKALQRAIRFLQADKPLEVSRDRNGYTPWIECKAMDTDASWLDSEKHQGSSKGRVFQTTMTARACRVPMNKQAKYVVFLQNPIDFRCAFVEYVQALFETPTSNEEIQPPEFSAGLSPDDFFDIDIETLDTEISSNSSRIKRYENYMLDWIIESQENPENVCLVFFEAMLHDPASEIKRVAEFLNLAYYDDLIGIILKDIVHDGLGSITSTGGENSAARVALRKMSIRRKSVRNKNGGGGGGGGGGPMKPLAVGGGNKMFSSDKASKARLAWVPISERIKGAENYNTLYELLYGRKYPYATAEKAAGGGCVVS